MTSLQCGYYLVYLPLYYDVDMKCKEAKMSENAILIIIVLFLHNSESWRSGVGERTAQFVQTNFFLESSLIWYCDKITKLFVTSFLIIRSSLQFNNNHFLEIFTYAELIFWVYSHRSSLLYNENACKLQNRDNKNDGKNINWNIKCNPTPHSKWNYALFYFY